MTDPTEIMKEIVATQNDLRAQEQAKKTLEVQLADVNQSILNDIQTLGQLQDQLNKALSHANVEATELDDFSAGGGKSAAQHDADAAGVWSRKGEDDE